MAKKQEKKHLTESAVEKESRPAIGRKEIFDTTPGLFLWVTPNGTKSWMAIYRLPDESGTRTVRHKKVLGRHPAMGVKAARDAASEMMALATKGIDPKAHVAEVKAAKERDEAEKRAGSFAAVVEEYIAAMKAGRSTGGRKRPVAARTAAIRKSLLSRIVLPELGDRDLSEITPKMVARLLSQIEKASGPVDEALAAIRLVFKFAQTRGLFHGLPPTAGMTSRQARSQETRALTDDELRAVWRAAGEAGWAFGSVLRLLMLTGQRRGEIAGLRWEEIDWDRRMLIIPVERVKNRAGAHEVPLTEPAMKILRAA